MPDVLPAATEAFPIEVVVVGVSSLTAIAVAAITSLANKDRRVRLLSDLEILGKLDSKGDAHRVLKESIERRVVATSDTGAKTRDWFSFILGALFLVVGVAVFSFVSSLGGWWQLLHVITGFFLLFGVAGIATGWKKVPRDEKGNEIKTEQVDTAQAQAPSAN